MCVFTFFFPVPLCWFAWVWTRRPWNPTPRWRRPRHGRASAGRLGPSRPVDVGRSFENFQDLTTYKILQCSKMFLFLPESGICQNAISKKKMVLTFQMWEKWRELGVFICMLRWYDCRACRGVTWWKGVWWAECVGTKSKCNSSKTETGRSWKI